MGSLGVSSQQLAFQGGADGLDELVLVQEAHLPLGGVHIHIHMAARQAYVLLKVRVPDSSECLCTSIRAATCAGTAALRGFGCRSLSCLNMLLMWQELEGGAALPVGPCAAAG